MIRTRQKEKPDADLSSGVLSKKFVINLEQPCASMCTNSSGSLLAVVGRKVFKILKIFPDQIQIYLDLRDLPGKQLNLNFSNNDVQWNPKDESQLATAPTNGCVILWDITKRTKSKIAHVFENTHQRAVNKLTYHPREANILISGSQDYTMNTFDTRQKTVVATYKGPESVRDVKFSQLQTNDNYFAACYDNGVLDIWDRRRGDNPMKQVPIHNGPVYCCDWHPENDNWILSAGRDKMIKVFDVQHGRPKEVFSVATCSSVARARWRPNHKHHIASCSQFLDNSVFVWDVRRPFIPFASFAEHSDDVTDFQWLNDRVLVSCSKDGKIIQQLFSDAQRPVERATPVGLSFRPDGCLSHACSESIVHRSKPIHLPQYGSSRHSYQPMTFKKADGDPYQQSFLLFSSSLTEHCRKDMDETEFFICCAKSYKLHGLPIHVLCDHNYKVACQLKRQDIARTWLMLKLLFCSSDPDCSRLGLIQTKAPSRPTASRQSLCQNTNAVDNGVDSHKVTTLDAGIKDGSTVEDSGQEENEEDTEENNAHDVDAVLDFFESDDQDSDLGPPQNVLQLESQQKWELPAEPIQIRHDVLLRPPTPDNELSSAHSTSHSAQESSVSLKQLPLDVSSYFKADCFVKPRWNFSHIVLKMLQFYAEQGDVQTSVSVLLVLGDKACELIDNQIMEQWFSSYVDLLIHYEQWSVAALVIKLCSLQQINQRSHDSTCYQTGCGTCNKLIEKKSWVCQRCEKISSICSVCNCTVRGLYVWCQGCGHGGHLQHMQSWYSKNSLCPAGCGHEC